MPGLTFEIPHASSASGQNGFHIVLQVVHHYPLGGAGLPHTRLPAGQAVEISTGISVVRTQLGDVQGNDADTIKLDREIAYRSSCPVLPAYPRTPRWS